MSMVGTFDGFTAARLGIYAAQHGLRVTGNNVSNINTMGYTRQRVDQKSFKAGANDMYRSLYDNHVGSGALVTGINQIRDPYLDIRYRDASTDTYHYDTWLAGLQGLASVLDEVGKGDNYGDGLIYAQLQDLADKLRAYGNNPTDLNERLVRNSATSLTALFHTAASGLQKRFNEVKTELGENISVVNEILTNIRDLNKSIRESDVHGDHALEMRDERNRQIDALSQYLDIKVEYSYEKIGGGIEVEKLTIKLNNANPDNAVHTDESILVDGVFATQLSVPKEKPVLNTYGEQYSYLKGFPYLKKISKNEAQKFVDTLNDGKNPGDEGYYTLDDLFKITEKDADGNEVEYYLIGTKDSDVANIYTETNDNFTIQLGKLLNIKGEAWKNTTTAWTEVGSATVRANAIFAYTVSADLGDSGSFIVGGTTYTVGVNITEDIVNDPAKFAKFIADNLDKSKYPGYTISSNAAGQVVFTANPDDPNYPPAEIPHLTVNDPDNTNWINVSNMSVLPSETYDEHGNVIDSVSYVLIKGVWQKVTLHTEHTHEVTLDDNDLHGILQAQREMLTEEGEFASARDVAIDENALVKRGIPYYIKSLDLLAQKFAQAYNQLNSGYAYNQDGNYIDAEGKELLLYDLYAENEDGTIGGDRPISATDGLTKGQRQNLLNNGYFLTNDLGQPIDENGNLITDKNGEPLGYFLTNALGEPVDKDGNVIKDENGDPVPVTKVTDLQPEDYDKLIVDMDKLMGPIDEDGLGGVKMGGILFSNRGDNSDPTGINASNISISADWSNGAVNVIRTFEMLFKDDGSGGLTNSTQPSNINHMIAMIEKSLTYDPRDLYGSDAIGPVLFSGSFNDMLSNMMAVEAEDANITGTRLTTSAGILNEVDYSREGVSGVDLNDEAMNMVQYQKAMTAAMRVMTTIDEMLDRLINNTGIAGR